MSKPNRKKDALARLLRGGRSFLRYASHRCMALRRRFPSASRVIGFSLSAALTVCIMCGIFSAAGLTYALEVTVNGTSYGYVESRQSADAALTDLCDNVETGSLCSEVSLDASLSYAVVSRDSILTPDELISTIVCGEEEYQQVVGVFADGRLVSYSSSRDAAKSELAHLSAGKSLYFCFEVRDCIVKSETLSELAPLSRVADCSLPVLLSVPCEEGDTDQTIAERLDVPVALIDALNTSATYAAGSTVSVVVDLPVFTAIATKLDYVTYVDEDLDEEGNAYLTTDTVAVDTVLDVPVRSCVISTERKKLSETKPVAALVESVGDYGFCWPLDKSYHQYVSSYWGDGRGHRAVDIAGHVGIPILSVLDGVVVSINDSGTGYGQHFVIDHGNGIQTLYAHCSCIYVKIGEKVSRGEVVGLVGSTGYSTGPHLHFEVILNGERVNPCRYLGID